EAGGEGDAGEPGRWLGDVHVAAFELERRREYVIATHRCRRDEHDRKRPDQLGHVGPHVLVHRSSSSEKRERLAPSTSLSGREIGVSKREWGTVSRPGRAGRTRQLRVAGRCNVLALLLQSLAVLKQQLPQLTGLGKKCWSLGQRAGATRQKQMALF